MSRFGRANKLSYRRWRSEEDEFLRQNYKWKYAKQLAGLLDRTVHAIHLRAWKLRICLVKKPILDWSSKKKELSYILGCIYGDGFFGRYKTRGGFEYVIGVNNTQKEFPQNFFEALKSIGLNPHFYREKSRDVYVTRVKSKVFFEWLSSLSLEQLESILVADLVSARYFLKGFYESEGYLTFNHRQLNKSPDLLGVNNTNEKLIRIAYKLMSYLGFQPRLQGPYTTFGRHKPLWRIHLYGTAQVGRFINEMNPCIKRTAQAVTGGNPN
ncbi:hypothetical protein ES706_02380 [subsurface metagenome]